MAVHTKLDLFQMQSLPLDAKIRMTVRRITDFIEYHDAYISISGGKDSRVLDDIESRFIGAGLPRVFVDTGLEHRSVRACGKRHADVTVRPEKNFKQIITEYGYPVISKEVAQTIAEARVGLKSGKGYTYRMKKLDGVAVDKNGEMSAPMSFWSENDVLEYLLKYEVDYAECYGEIVPKLDKEQIRGQITIYEATNDYKGCQFCTTGCKRTGCIFCLFGILQDRDRILKLEKEDKRLADYVLGGGEYDKEGMWIPTNKGLGYMKVLDFLNENGLEIPY